MEQSQRFYLVFSRGRGLRFLSHLDMMRLWERAIRRAGLRLRYSQGYHPHPRVSLALPLAVGMTAEAEWLELEIQGPVRLEDIGPRLSPQLPVGLVLHQVREAARQAPALAAQLQGGEYEVEVRSPLSPEQAQDRVAAFLASESWPLEEERKGRRRTVDLRRGVASLRVSHWEAGGGRLNMVLRHGPESHVRPDVLSQALGFGTQVLIQRKRLLFHGPESGNMVVR